jgi:two-component system chemotaxis response regulator CheY
MKVLIVDDSKAMRMIVKRSLRQTGLGPMEVVEADNGRAALEHLQREPADLVLCDWNMPEMTGIELLRKLKDESVPVRFGFVTSESTEEMRAQAQEAGALFLLSKPFTAEMLRAELAALAA